MKELTYYAEVMGGEAVIRYCPREPFRVDGIAYDRRLAMGLFSLRPMIEILDDYSEDDDCFDFEDEAAHMFHSDPPTDAELNLYTHLGLLPPT